MIVKVALVQKAPVFFNSSETFRLYKDLLTKSANNGAKLVVFPETWFAGYPIWLDESPDIAKWANKGAENLFARMFEESLCLKESLFQKLVSFSRKLNLYVSLGANERIGGTIYNSQVLIGPGPKELNIHRKLVPTYTERLVWGRGDGSSLKVMNSPFGNIGGLICWEHWMPFSRAVLHDQKESFHIASWPTVRDIHQVASRHYAFEGQCYVLASGTYATKKNVIEGYRSKGNPCSEALQLLQSMTGPDSNLVMKGGSCVVAPNGELLDPPCFDNVEIIYADCDTEEINKRHLVLDTNGHYSRPDIFQLKVNTKKLKNVSYES